MTLIDIAGTVAEFETTIEATPDGNEVFIVTATHPTGRHPLTCVVTSEQYVQMNNSVHDKLRAKPAS